MSDILHFTAVLNADENSGGVHIDFPYDVKTLFGTNGNVKVKLTYDGIPHRGLLTNMGGGCHFLGLKKELREQLGKQAGDTVAVTLALDTEERTVEIPEALALLLEENPTAKLFFDTLSFSNRKEYAVWIRDAKREETRVNRLTATLEKLHSGKKNPAEK
jgi:hypothetical protein